VILDVQNVVEEVRFFVTVIEEIVDIFLPLIDHFVADPDDKKDPDLVNETVQCFGRLLSTLTSVRRQAFWTAPLVLASLRYCCTTFE
jgi:hypothetical protein